MRVATKIALGSGLLLLPLVGVMAYHVDQLNELASVNRNLAANQFSAATQSIELVQQIELLDEYLRKAFVSFDPGYLEKLEQAQIALEDKLRGLHSLRLSDAERGESDRLMDSWHRFRTAAVIDQPAEPRSGTRVAKSRLAKLVDRLRATRTRAQALIAATKNAIVSQVASSTEVSRQTKGISWIATTSALVLSLAALLLTIRSINRPLRRLTEATRAVSKGRFSVQLESAKEDEFASLTRAFNSMVQRLGELDKMKKDFLSHISHELKTPLVAMQETNRLLLDEIPGRLSPKQRRLLELNLDGGIRLSKMISDLLDLSRMEAMGVTYRFARHDLAALVEKAAAEFEARALERNIQLALAVPDRPIAVLCDGDRVIQVVENLLENAVRHTPGSGCVSLRVGRANHGEGESSARWPRQARIATAQQPCALVQVADSGPGVPATERERIFERFFQAKKAGRGPGRGVGLGLAICREIIAAHRGAIWVEESEHNGAAFVFFLPAVVEPHAETRGDPLHDPQPGARAAPER